jgi:hypothetical protein
LVIKLDAKEVSCHSETPLTATGFQRPITPQVPYDMVGLFSKADVLQESKQVQTCRLIVAVAKDFKIARIRS